MRKARKSEEGKLALFQVIVRLINQGSRLSAVRFAQNSIICELLGIETLHEDKLYENLDWLAAHQEEIEKQLFVENYGKKIPELFLYDVASSYRSGNESALADG